MTCCQIIVKIAENYEVKAGDVCKSIPNLGNKANHVIQ